MKMLRLLIISFIYAVVRYVAFTPVNAEHIPVLIINKVVSTAAAFALVYALWSQHKGRTETAARYFKFVLVMVVMHVPMSLTLLRPGYFNEFFHADGEQLHLLGELVVFFGAAALALVWLLSQGDLIAKMRQRLGLLLLVILTCHVAAMGACRGFNINAKHAYLPPMWLLCGLVLLVGLGLGLRRSRT